MLMIDCHLRIGAFLHVGVEIALFQAMNNEPTPEDQYTKEGYLQCGGRKQRQHAAYTQLGHAPHLAGVVSKCKKLARSILRFIILTLFATYTRFPAFILTFIKIVGNFCSLLHLDRVSKEPMVE